MVEAGSGAGPEPARLLESRGLRDPHTPCFSDGMLVQGHDDPMATDNPSRRPYGAWARRLALGSLAVLGLWFALDLLPGQRARTFAVWRAAELERGVSVARVPEQVAHETRVLGFLACLAVLAAGAVRAGQRHEGRR